jgi:hypothetical protein
MKYKISQAHIERNIERNLARTDEEIEASWDDPNIIYIEGDLDNIENKNFTSEHYINPENENDPTCEYDYSKKTKNGRYKAKCRSCKGALGARTTKKINEYLVEYRYFCKKCNIKIKITEQTEPFFPELEHSEETIKTHFTTPHTRFWWSAVVGTYIRRHKELASDIETLKEELRVAELKLKKTRDNYVLLHGIAHDETVNKMNEDDLYRMKNAWIVGLR